jgi:polyphosphate kinase
VKSLVGEFLEHSRVFIFGSKDTKHFSVLFGSADLMERNLDRRVEVTVPIQDAAIQDEIVENFDISWSDDLYTWVLGTDRRWRRLQPVNNISAQRIFKARAIQRSRELL